MAPAAMMAPCPGIRRGLEDMVPTVPGLVSEMVVPWKSAGVSLPVRARATRSSKAVRYSWKLRAPAFLMLGTIRTAGAVFARDIHGDAQIDLGPHDAVGLAVFFGVGVVEAGKLFECLHHGPADEVGVGDFALADQGAVLVDDAAVLVHHLDGDGALRGGQGNGDAGGHVLGDFAGDAAQGLKLFARQRLRRGGGVALGRCGRGSRRREAVGLLKNVLPAFVHGGAVVQILLI